jgi:hypothetical protein
MIPRCVLPWLLRIIVGHVALFITAKTHVGVLGALVFIGALMGFPWRHA